MNQCGDGRESSFGSIMANEIDAIRSRRTPNHPRIGIRAVKADTTSPAATEVNPMTCIILKESMVQLANYP
jgi:hypothetical protein